MPPQWVNPDPPSWKALIGNCRRVDQNPIEKVINEGIVASDEECGAFCKSNPKECTAHQFTESTKICKTFTGKFELEGNGDIGSRCTIKEKDIVQTFNQLTGKCQRIDSKDIENDKQQSHIDIADVSACKQLCAKTCSPRECPCKAYQYNSDDKVCKTFTETERLIGDTTNGYNCFIE